MNQIAATPALNTLPLGWRRHLRLAYRDVVESIRIWRLWVLMATNDIAQRYRRSLIGPFWLTISSGILILSLGVVYSYLFKIPVDKYLPYLAAGQVVWTFISTVLLDAGSAFVMAEGYIKQVRMPKLAFLLRLTARNLIIMAHNMVMFVVVWIYYRLPLTWETLLFIPGLLLVVVAGTAVSLVFAVVCTRFRDLPQIISSLLQVTYFITPIMWQRSQLSADNQAIVNYNPLAVFLDVARGPLLGEIPPLSTWLAALEMTVLVCVLAYFFFARFRARIPYWL